MHETGEHELKTALKWGWRWKYLNCGRGAMMENYLSEVQIYSECGQELFHQRVDDGLAYLPILICGHLMSPTFFTSIHFGSLNPYRCFSHFGLDV